MPTPATEVQIPLFPYSPPLFRVQYRPTFGAVFATDGCRTSATDWSTLSQPPNNSLTDGGVELEEIHRVAFPEIGTASFRYIYGNLFGTTATAPALDYYEVRLQLSNDSGATWSTEFWGQVICTERIGAPGSATPQGIMRYHVVDGFARTMKWVLDYTGYDTGGSGTGGAPLSMGPCRGHPGYNYMLQSDGPLLGNLSPSKTFTVDGVSVNCHTFQGAFSVPGADPTIQTSNKWFEIDMINHSCATVKPTGEPLFVLAQAGTPANHGYRVVSPQPVYPNESVWDFVVRVTNRQRGNGAVWVDWVDNVDGSLTVSLKYCPLNQADITYTTPGYATSNTIEGSDTVGTTYAFDGGPSLVLEGDHRNVDEAFTFSDGEMHLYDMLETVGEQIEVGVTLCSFDGPSDDMTQVYAGYSYSLAPRWSDADVTAYAALPWDKRTMPYWNFVFQTFGLPRDWAGCVGSGFNTNKLRADYRCGNDGNIIAPAITDPVDTAANMVELLGFLPFFEGYKYSGTYPEKTDNATQYGLPQRRPIMIMVRPSGWENSSSVGSPTDQWFLPGGQLPQVVTDEKIYPQSLGEFFSPQVTVQPDGVIMTNVNAQNAGVRVISDPVVDASLPDGYKLEAVLPVTRVAMTIGLRLPHRLRFADYAVYGVTNAPPGGPSPGTAVLVGSAPTGAWVGHAGETATWDGTIWTFSGPSGARKRKVVYIENANFWLAAPNCIYDFSQSASSTHGYDPLRGALGTNPAVNVPAILRDDRAFVYRYHKLASKWYLQPRSRIVFAMKYCGFLSFTWLKAGIAQTGRHPDVGHFIVSAIADGNTLVTGTVVTSKRYNHQTGITTWETDWFDLEHV